MPAEVFTIEKTRTGEDEPYETITLDSTGLVQIENHDDGTVKTGGTELLSNASD